MSGKRYTKEFKSEAVKQVTDRGYSASEVSERLGVTTNSLYTWLKKAKGFMGERRVAHGAGVGVEPET